MSIDIRRDRLHVQDSLFINSWKPYVCHGVKKNIYYIVVSNMHDVNVLKRKLAKSFAMKDLGAAKKILGMRITIDRKNKKFTLSKGEYI